MKSVFLTGFLSALLLGCTPKGDAEVVIKTSAVCDMCKNTIEKKLKDVEGIASANLNVDTKEITVSYFSAKTSPEKIRKAIAEVGYDADDVKAVPEAYEKLEECCKKEK
ncbi:MAG: cation transporter [Cytophagales bacterium]|nr:cation transporter [Cytophagales bacterium]MDW8384903.1 heavy metal-associated domain-containing protein [Flammeovirgaceae bacterium]